MAPDQVPRRLKITPRAAHVLIGAVAVAGLTAQYLQQEDPTNPLRYFTVWSALLVALGCLSAELVPNRATSLVRLTGCAGALFSALVYWFAISPEMGLGQWIPTIVANLLLHAALPFAIVFSYAVSPCWQEDWPRTLWALTLPALYLTYSWLTQLLLGSASVYPFINVETMTPLSLLAVVVVGGAAIALLAQGLGLAPRVFSQRHP